MSLCDRAWRRDSGESIRGRGRVLGIIVPERHDLTLYLVPRYSAEEPRCELEIGVHHMNDLRVRREETGDESLQVERFLVVVEST